MKSKLFWLNWPAIRRSGGEWSLAVRRILGTWWGGAAASVVALTVLAVAGVLMPPYQTGILTLIVVLGLFAMSLNLLLGYTGLPSLGHAAYFGVGAYTVGILSLRVTPDFWINVLAALGMCAALGAVFGLLALRTTGAYFLLITLALGQVAWSIAFGWRRMTGGDDGLPGIARPDLGLPWSLWDANNYFIFTVLVFGIAVGIMYVLVRSPFGYTLQGIRESEQRMQALGYNTWLYKYLAFILASVFAGVAGVLYVYYNGFIGVEQVGVAMSAEVLLMVIIGGTGTFLGPLLGAAIIETLRNLVSAHTERWMLVLGLTYILVVLFARQGLLGLVLSWLRRRPGHLP